jgi:hypothetical protein
MNIRQLEEGKFRISVGNITSQPTLDSPPAYYAVMDRFHRELSSSSGKVMQFEMVWHSNVCKLEDFLFLFMEQLETHVPDLMQQPEAERVHYNFRWKRVFASPPTILVNGNSGYATKIRNSHKVEIHSPIFLPTLAVADKSEQAIRLLLTFCLTDFYRMDEHWDDISRELMIQRVHIHQHPWEFRQFYFPENANEESALELYDGSAAYEWDWKGKVMNEISIMLYEYPRTVYIDQAASVNNNQMLDTQHVLTLRPMTVRRSARSVTHAQVIVKSNWIHKKFRDIYCFHGVFASNQLTTQVDRSGAAEGLLTVLLQYQEYGWNMVAEYIIRECVMTPLWYKLVQWLLFRPTQVLPKIMIHGGDNVMKALKLSDRLLGKRKGRF